MGCLATGRDRLVELAQIAQREAEIGMGLGKIRRDADGLATGGDGLVEQALVAQCEAEITEIGGVVRVAPYRSADQIDGEVMAAHLLGDGAQEVQGVGMVGLARQHLLVTGLGFRQSSRLVVRNARREEIGDACSRGGRRGRGWPGVRLLAAASGGSRFMGAFSAACVTAASSLEGAMKAPAVKPGLRRATEFQENDAILAPGGLSSRT